MCMEVQKSNIIKAVRSPFRLKKKENKTIKGRIIRDIKKLFEKEKDYYKSVKGKFYSNKKYSCSGLPAFKS